ncbi:MAG: hypothetical protein EBU84_03380 [Actinobacteria bacterium]|nr:hypothetical protein [Actinomycetota bacterium]
MLSDRWWETETNWFSWCVPERKLSGWTYCQARPNASICNGGAWVWDDSSPFEWGLPYHANYSGLQLPPRSERDMRDFEWPNGVHTKTLEPLKKYQIRYSDPGAFELDIVFDAIMPPNPHPIGVAPFYKGVHFDQAGRVTGSMILHGESIAIDCFAVRDRSWGPRPQGRPKKRKSTDHDQLAAPRFEPRTTAWKRLLMQSPSRFDMATERCSGATIRPMFRVVVETPPPGTRARSRETESSVPWVRTSRMSRSGSERNGSVTPARREADNS